MDGAPVGPEMELLRVVLDSVNEAVVIRSADGRVIDCNVIAEKIFGLTRGQLLQDEGIPPSYRTTSEDGAPMDLSNSPGAITIRTGVAQKAVPLKLHLPDGTLRWIQVSTTPLPDGRTEPPFGVVICLSDITEERTARELALVAERRIEAMLEHSEGGVFEADFQHGYVSRSQHLYALVGRTPEEVTTHIDGWYAFVHEEDKARLVFAWDELRAGRSPTVDCEYRLRHKDGRWLWVHSLARITRKDSTGRAQRASGTVTNITERKKLQEELRVANETIARLTSLK